MAIIEFKSVGSTSSSVQLHAQSTAPIGFKTPIRLGKEHEGIFAMHMIFSEQIRDNMKNLILTNRGERLGNYAFGADLRPTLFELSTDTFDDEIARKIKTAVGKHMPYVQLKTMETKIIPSSENDGLAIIALRVHYDVPSINALNQAIDITFYVGG